MKRLIVLALAIGLLGGFAYSVISGGERVADKQQPDSRATLVDTSKEPYWVPVVNCQGKPAGFIVNPLVDPDAPGYTPTPEPGQTCPESAEEVK